MTSGGTRTGAGRKPGSPNHVAGPGRLPKSYTLKLGDQLATYTETATSSTGIELAEVIAITRSKVVIKVGEVNLVIVR
jgi:hypothetical protein